MDTGEPLRHLFKLLLSAGQVPGDTPRMKWADADLNAKLRTIPHGRSLSKRRTHPPLWGCLPRCWYDGRAGERLTGIRRRACRSGTLRRLSSQEGDAVPRHVLRPTSSRPVFLPRHLASGLVAYAAAVVLASCSGSGVDPSKWDWSAAPDLGVPLIVHIQNSTAADFWGSAGPVQVGSDFTYLFLWSKTPPSSLPYFDVRRGADQSNAVKLARITFRVLKYPESNSSNGQDVTIALTEPSAGVFAATTLDTAWIEIVSVTPLP